MVKTFCMIEVTLVCRDPQQSDTKGNHSSPPPPLYHSHKKVDKSYIGGYKRRMPLRSKFSSDIAQLWSLILIHFNFGADCSQHRHTWHQSILFSRDRATNSEATATGMQRANLAAVHHIHMTQRRHAEPAE